MKFLLNCDIVAVTQAVVSRQNRRGLAVPLKARSPHILERTRLPHQRGMNTADIRPLNTLETGWDKRRPLVGCPGA